MSYSIRNIRTKNDVKEYFVANESEQEDHKGWRTIEQMKQNNNLNHTKMISQYETEMVHKEEMAKKRQELEKSTNAFLSNELISPIVKQKIQQLGGLLYVQKVSENIFKLINFETKRTANLEIKGDTVILKTPLIISERDGKVYSVLDQELNYIGCEPNKDGTTVTITTNYQQITFDPLKQIPVPATITVYRSTVDAESTPPFSGGDSKKNSKKKSKQIRKHQGIYQSGGNAGKLKPGYRYNGQKTKTGLKVIVRK